jgi:hypothetical protein
LLNDTDTEGRSAMAKNFLIVAAAALTMALLSTTGAQAWHHGYRHHHWGHHHHWRPHYYYRHHYYRPYRHHWRHHHWRRHYWY